MKAELESSVRETVGNVGARQGQGLLRPPQTWTPEREEGAGILRGERPAGWEQGTKSEAPGALEGPAQGKRADWAGGVGGARRGRVAGRWGLEPGVWRVGHSLSS